MRDLPQENSQAVIEVRNVSETIIKSVGDAKGDTVVVACLNVALMVVQGGAGLDRLSGIDALIEVLYKMRAAEAAEKGSV